jgi:cytochrome d ubiquinol oxidase subunit I
MAFFLEATFVGLMFFGWDKLPRVGHLGVTFLVALGTNLSALWILVANGWMQNPVGAAFNPDTMRMEVADFRAVLFNPVAQAKFVHTVSAGYTIAAVFVLGVSAFYLLKGRHVGVAKRSMTVAAAFGLASSLSVVVLGDESGYALTDNQKMKLAALEAMWETEPAPAGLTAFGIPSLADRKTHYEVKIPYVLGLIATRSIDKPVAGIFELVAVRPRPHRVRRRRLWRAGDAEGQSQGHQRPRGVRDCTAATWAIALLLKRYVADPRMADAALIKKTSWDTVPNVPVMFWAFRIMAGHRPSDDRPVRHGLRVGHPAQARHQVVPASSPWLRHPAALDLHRVGLGAGRGRAPALGGGGRAAHLPGASSLTVPSCDQHRRSSPCSTAPWRWSRSG